MNANKMAIVLRLLGIGWYVAICIGGGTYGGVLLDKQFDSVPLLTLIGLGIGIAAAVVGMTKMLMAVLATKSNTDTDEP